MHLFSRAFILTISVLSFSSLKPNATDLSHKYEKAIFDILTSLVLAPGDDASPVETPQTISWARNAWRTQVITIVKMLLTCYHGHDLAKKLKSLSSIESMVTGWQDNLNEATRNQVNTNKNNKRDKLILIQLILDDAVQGLRTQLAELAHS